MSILNQVTVVMNYIYAVESTLGLYFPQSMKSDSIGLWSSLELLFFFTER
jgi:hypothetical protein